MGRTFVFIGTPLTALFITAIVAMVLLVFMQGRIREFINSEVGKSFASVAGIVFIVAAGGGFKQKTAYEIRIRDWSSDVCSSDLAEDSTSNSPDANNQKAGPVLHTHTNTRRAKEIRGRYRKETV